MQLVTVEIKLEVEEGRRLNKVQVNWREGDRRAGVFWLQTTGTDSLNFIIDRALIEARRLARKPA